MTVLSSKVAAQTNITNMSETHVLLKVLATTLGHKRNNVSYETMKVWVVKFVMSREAKTAETETNVHLTTKHAYVCFKYTAIGNDSQNRSNGKQWSNKGKQTSSLLCDTTKRTCLIKSTWWSCGRSKLANKTLFNMITWNGSSVYKLVVLATSNCLYQWHGKFQSYSYQS